MSLTVQLARAGKLSQGPTTPTKRVNTRQKGSFVDNHVPVVAAVPVVPVVPDTLVSVVPVVPVVPAVPDVRAAVVPVVPVVPLVPVVVTEQNRKRSQLRFFKPNEGKLIFHAPKNEDLYVVITPCIREDWPCVNSCVHTDMN